MDDRAITRDMLGAAHDVTLERGDVILSANLLTRIYLAMRERDPMYERARALARSVMADQIGTA